MNLQFSKDRLRKTGGGSPQGPSNSNSPEDFQRAIQVLATPTLPPPAAAGPGWSKSTLHSVVCTLVQGSGFVSPVNTFCAEELERRGGETGESNMVGAGFSAVHVIYFPRALNCNFKLLLGFLKLYDLM